MTRNTSLCEQKAKPFCPGLIKYTSVGGLQAIVQTAGKLKARQKTKKSLIAPNTSTERAYS